MQVIRIVAGMFYIGWLATDSPMARGADYPHKPIRVIAGGVGGGQDFVVRVMAPGLTDGLGQPVIVDNRPSGVVPQEIVSKAAADGYTLLITTSILWIGPYLQKVPYDPVRDFSPISTTNSAPNILVVHPSVPVKSAAELIGLAKGKPGTLNCSVGPTGSTSHLAAELFNYMAGVKIQLVPFTSAASKMAALVGGDIQLEFATPGAVAPHVQSGRLRALAVTSAAPSALLPGLPTVAATGLPGYESVGMTGMFAPAKTPGAIVNRLNVEITRVLNRPDVKDKLLGAGVEAGSSTPEQFAAKIKADMLRLGKVIQAVGARAQ